VVRAGDLPAWLACVDGGAKLNNVARCTIPARACHTRFITKHTSTMGNTAPPPYTTPVPATRQHANTHTHSHTHTVTHTQRHTHTQPHRRLSRLRHAAGQRVAPAHTCTHGPSAQGAAAVQQYAMATRLQAAGTPSLPRLTAVHSVCAGQRGKPGAPQVLWACTRAHQGQRGRHVRSKAAASVAHATSTAPLQMRRSRRGRWSTRPCSGGWWSAARPRCT
jgi:hypothetical protein